MELEDLIADYPFLDEVPDFQGMMQSKQEFYELSATTDETPPNPYYKHQLLFQRMMGVYDVCLNIPEAGTGKTCSFAALAEYCKKHLPHIKRAVVVCGEKQLQDFKKQLVMKCTNGVYITEGVRKAKNQRGKSSAMTSALKDFYAFITYEQLTRETEEKYPIGNPIWNGERWIVDSALIRDSNKKLGEDYSGTLVLFDEIHFSRIEEKKHGFTGKGSNREPSGRIRQYLTIWRISHLAFRSKRLFFTATPVTNTGSEMIYLLNLIYRSDKQLYSPLMEDILGYGGIEATFIDSERNDKREWSGDPTKVSWTNEVARSPLSVSWQDGPDFETRRDQKVMLDEYVAHFAKNLNGQVLFVATSKEMAKISYIPLEQSPLTVPDYMIENIEVYRNFAARMHANGYNPMERIRPVHMLGVQRDVYRNFSESLNLINDDEEPANNALFYNQRSICIGVFPDGTHGSVGMLGVNSKGEFVASPWIIVTKEEIIISDKERRKIEKYSINPDKLHDGYDLAYWYGNYLQLFSCKMYYIVLGAMYLFGKRYVVSTYIYGGGAVMLGIALECAIYRDPKTGQPDLSKKFERYYGTERTFESAEIEDEDSPDENRRRVILSPKFRYAMVSGSTSSSDIANIFALYNHPSNSDGKYLKVIIISKVGQTGINLMDTLFVDFLDIPWSPGTQYQAERRVVRIQAHKALERLRGTHLPGGKHTEIEVAILVPQLVNDDGSPVTVKGHELNTVDLQIYLRSADRSVRNAVPYRALKIVAADNRLQRKRNILDPSISYTPEADYMDTYYPCLGWDGMNYSYVDCPQRTSVDTSTYDVYYQDVIIERNIPVVKSFFNMYLFATIDEIYYAMASQKTYVELMKGVVKRKYVLMTLKHIIKNQIRLVDSYGYQCFLRETNGVFYLTRTDSKSDTMSDITTVYYNSNIIASRYKTFSEVVGDIYYGKSYRLFNVIESSDDPAETFAKVIFGIDINELIGLVELVVKKYMNEIKDIIDKKSTGESYPLARLVFEKYYTKNLFILHEPTQYIGAISKSLDKKKADIKALFALWDTNRSSNPDEPVFVHNFYSLMRRESRAGISAKLSIADFRIRILRLSEGIWRDPYTAESYAYRKFFSQKYNDAEKTLQTRFPRHYAKYINDGAFQIVSKEFEKTSAGHNEVEVHLGQYIYSYSAIELLYFMWQFGINIPDRTYYDGDNAAKRRFLSKNPMLFNYNWVIRKGQTNSVPDDFVTYCYDFFYKNEHCAANAVINKNLLCELICAKYIETGRVFEGDGLDVIDFYIHKLNDKIWYSNRSR